MAKPKSLPYEAPEEAGPYHVDLHSQAGGSDKVYKISIEASGALWIVNYANGRRGGTLATGTKTASPVSYPEARKIANGVLFDKVGGGYVPTGGTRFGDGMQAEAIAAIAREASGVIPQLLNPVDPDDIERLIEDDNTIVQAKHDGERRTLIVAGGEAKGSNRKGQTVALTRQMKAAAESFGFDFTVDGEQVGDKLYVFDILKNGEIDLTSRPLGDRLMHLNAFNARVNLSSNGNVLHAIEVVETAEMPAAKRALVERVKAEGGEGVVFKALDGRYVAGRPAKGGDWLKLKFWQSLSAVVSGHNAQRSVGLSLIGEDGKRLPVGNVTIPPNADIPAVGAVVEVGYLYAFDKGSLFQPTFKGLRTDLVEADCRATQRVFKQETPEADVAPGM